MKKNFILIFVLINFGLEVEVRGGIHKLDDLRCDSENRADVPKLKEPVYGKETWCNVDMFFDNANACLNYMQKVAQNRVGCNLALAYFYTKPFPIAGQRLNSNFCLINTGIYCMDSPEKRELIDEEYKSMAKSEEYFKKAFENEMKYQQKSFNEQGTPNFGSMFWFANVAKELLMIQHPEKYNTPEAQNDIIKKYFGDPAYEMLSKAMQICKDHNYEVQWCSFTNNSLSRINGFVAGYNLNETQKVNIRAMLPQDYENTINIVRQKSQAKYYNDKKTKCEQNRDDCREWYNALIISDNRENRLAAIKLAKELCDENRGYGCVELAFQYERGMLIRQDIAKALEYYGKGCDLGNGSACRYYKTLNTKIINGKL